MGYKGLEMTSQEDYIFSETIPYNPEFDFEELKAIQGKIEDYTSGRSAEGLTPHEAEVFLDWVTFNARSYATREIPESALTASLQGQCAPTQAINYKLLSRMGLDVRTFNTSKCIGEIPMTQEDIERVQKGWDSTAVRHSVSLVNIPIIDNNGNTNLRKFMLDPTFRQFCQKQNCNYNKFFDQVALQYGRVAPHPGFFMQAENLRQMGVNEETAQKSELLCKEIISKGYFYLNEENAKLYGDAFVRASKRLEFQDIPIDMEGKQYIENFENIPMQILRIEDEEKYTQTPAEIEESRNNKGIFSRIANWFKSKFNKQEQPLMLVEGKESLTTKDERKVSELSEEELATFRESEKHILEEHSKGQDENITQKNLDREM